MHERHGFNNKDRLYRIWVAMRQRCAKPYRSSFAEYGGRGIRVCDEWDRSFVAFRSWAVANGYADTLSIDRKDGTKGYSPENCRWATAKQQRENQREGKHLLIVEHAGQRLTLSQWARDTGIGYTTLVRRYHSGKRGPSLFAPVA